MTALSDLTTRIRVALAVSDSYEATIIPAAIREQVRYFLRGWNFPKSLTIARSAALAINASSTPAPALAKKLNVVLLVDETSSPFTYKHLLRSDQFRYPQRDGVPSYYWLAETNLHFDTPLPAALKLELWYQSVDPELAIDWMITEYGDTLFFRVVFALSADLRKKEVMEVYGPLWGEAKRDLAVFLNELEFDQVELNMRDVAFDTRRNYYSRYPR